MTQQTQTDVKPESKAKPSEEVVDASSYEQPIWGNAATAEHAPRQITPRQMLQLQRSVGNTAAHSIMQGKMGNRAALNAQATPPPTITAAPAESIQRAGATVKGKTFGKTSLRSIDGTVVGKVAKGTEIDVDTDMSTREVIGKKGYYLVNNPESLFPSGKAPLTAVYIEDMAVALIPETPTPSSGASEPSSAPAPEVESDPASLEIELFGGHKITITPDGAELSGEFETENEVPLPGVDLSIDIPIPAAPGVYISAGLSVTPELSMTAKGTYTLAKTSSETKFTIDGKITGTTGLEITAKALVGVGLANVAGLSAGLFAEAKASAELSGVLKGDVTKRADKTWKSSSLTLGLEAEASIVGAVGAMVEAKLGPLTASKKYKFKEKEFAKFEWERKALSIQKAGLTLSSLRPTFPGDFTVLVDKDSESPMAEISDTTPLLASSARSSDAEED